MVYQALPAVIALAFKLILLGYAVRAPRKHATTRLFTVLLILFSAHNVVEIAGFQQLYTHGLDQTLRTIGYLYFAVGSIFIALILHISLLLSIDRPTPKESAFWWLLYLPVPVLEYFLWSGNKLVAGFTLFSGYTIYRVPGELYFLFETYAILYLLAALTYLFYGARRSRTPIINRTRNRLWLIALLPFVLLNAYLIIANHFGLARLSSTISVPIAITLFLAITTYATHQHRLFDIEFYIPWSNIRKRKTAFYDRIRAMIAEIADVGSGSINQAIHRLSDTLRCPVTLVDDSKLVLATAGSPQMGTIPLQALRNIDHILVANEIAAIKPDTYAIMKQYGVAAIVPFHPHSQSAASWLLLGDSFSDEVYSPRDFRMVEQLFDKMADLFLDKLVAMRMQLADAQRHILSLETRLQAAESNLVLLRDNVETLAQENARLLREQPADSLVSVSGQRHAPFTLTLLGRDKELLRVLRQRFTQTESYAGPESSSFRRQALPDLLVVKIEDDASVTERRLLQILETSHRRCAVLVYGARAQGFSYDNRRQLAGAIVEAIPSDIGEDAFLRKVSAMGELRSALHSVTDSNYPLLGNSTVFKEAMTEAARLAGLSDSILIKTTDTEEAVTVARYMHDTSAVSGEFIVLRASQTEDELGHADDSLGELLARARNGTLMIDNIGALSNGLWEQLLSKSKNFSEMRLIAGSPSGASVDPAKSLQPLHPFVLEMPSLRQRRADIPLLVHYFTLHFNLQSGSLRYLTQADIDRLMLSDYPSDLRALKSAVFGRLMAKEKSEVTELPTMLGDGSKTLEERIATFEAQVIVDTLKRCNGNKSKAARMLGMRPNTLHYKLERYGIQNK